MDNRNNTRSFRNMAIVAAAMTVMSLIHFQDAAAPQPDQLPYSAFTTAVDQGEIRSVTIQGQDVVALRTAGGSVTTYMPQGADLIAQLQRRNVEIKAAPPAQPSLLLGLLLSILPFALMIGISIWMARKAMGSQGGGGLMSIGKSKARLLKPGTPVSFDDDLTGWIWTRLIERIDLEPRSVEKTLSTSFTFTKGIIFIPALGVACSILSGWGCESVGDHGFRRREPLGHASRQAMLAFKRRGRIVGHVNPALLVLSNQNPERQLKGKIRRREHQRNPSFWVPINEHCRWGQDQSDRTGRRAVVDRRKYPEALALKG
jgi:hypothetical protein